MSKPNAVINVIPEDIRCQDNPDNRMQAFLVALKEILDEGCKYRFFLDKNNVITKRRVEEEEDVEKIEGVRFKVISKT